MSENHLRAGNIELVLQGLFLQSHLEDSDEGRTKMSFQWTVRQTDMQKRGHKSSYLKNSAYGGT